MHFSGHIVLLIGNLTEGKPYVLNEISGMAILVPMVI
jgi:hypothetical protein